MATGFDFVGEDFRRELDTIKELLSVCYGEDTTPPTAAPVRIASSNACVLLLGASFEEFSRELVREYAQSVVDGNSQFTQLPAEFTVAIWERATYILRGAKFGKAEFDPSAAASALNQLQRFCLNGEKEAAIAKTVAYNENNLRPKEFNLMFKRLGISDYLSHIGHSQPIIEFFGTPDGGASHGKMIEFINKFYDTRNDVSHSIGSLRASGPGDLSRYIEFFEIFCDFIVVDLKSRLAL